MYLHLRIQLIAERFANWDGTHPVVEYVHGDLLGSSVARTTSKGAITERERSLSCGQALDGSKREAPGFTGHMEDPGLGLVYMQQRYYDPAIGRFLSVDPVGLLSDPVNHVNRYRYARNNPYRFIDPDGAADIIFFQRDENLVPAARRFDIPNWFTVMGHAGVREPDWELRTRDDRRSQKIWAWPRLSTQQHISEIREGGLSSRDQGVFLAMCNIGQVAAQVASDLGKPVIAADGFVWGPTSWSGGDIVYTASSTDKSNLRDRTFNVYQPNGTISHAYSEVSMKSDGTVWGRQAAPEIGTRIRKLEKVK